MTEREERGRGRGGEAQRRTSQSCRPAEEHRPPTGLSPVPTTGTSLCPHSDDGAELRGRSFIRTQPPTNPLQLCTSCQALAREPAARIYRISEPPVPPQAFHTPGGGQERRGTTGTDGRAALPAGIGPGPGTARHAGEETNHQSRDKFERKGKITVSVQYRKNPKALQDKILSSKEKRSQRSDLLS